MKKMIGVAVLGAALIAGSVTAAEAAPKRFTVSVKLSTKKASVGKAITITGKVSGQSARKLKGKKVTLQRKYAGGGWRKVKTAKIKSNRSYRFKTTMIRGGNTTYRVVKARSGKIRTGRSRARTTAVYKWIDVTTAPGYFVKGADFNTQPVAMLGRTYPKNFNSTFHFRMSFNIHNCTNFRTTFGFSDLNRSALPATAGVRIWPFTNKGDHTLAHYEDHGPHDVGRDQVRTVTIKLPEVDFINISVNGVSDISTVDAYNAPHVGTAVLASPMLRCNGESIAAIPAAWLSSS